ncbi:MAG TPA: alpha/beta fold hydrolase [Roseiarcus sp.]|nr:alpha/beta fold hydrolase [Roseiarcus sp.]
MNDQQSSEAERQLGLPEGSYPFESHFAEIAGAQLHYADEGDGPVLLMIHGNPTWSVLYRGLIEGLKEKYRCVAVDLAGFGLSTPPPNFSFRPEDEARLLAGLVDRLNLRQATLLAHDWGGPIGLGAAMTTGRIGRLCLGNTWAWPLNGDFHFEWFSKLMGGPIGRFGSERYLAFINLVMPSAMRRRKLSAQELDLYRAPFRAFQSRRPLHVLPWEIVASRDYLARVRDFVAGFHGPAFFIWPENDIAFRDKELARWKELLPQAGVRRLPRCGHFPWIDAPEDCLTAIKGFLAGESPAS